MQNSKFEYLLLRQLYRKEQIVARMYANGCWYQFSGKDVCAHIFLGTQFWGSILPSNKIKKNIIFITSNSYHSFIASFASILCGYNVIWLPSHLSAEQIQAVFQQYDCIAVATDVKDYATNWTDHDFPIIGIDNVIWMDNETNLEEKYKKFKQYLKSELGCFRFISFQSFYKFNDTSINMDIFLKIAQNFIDHIAVPKNIKWQSFEIMGLSHPFVHLSKFCCLMNKGIIGFPNYNSDLETSLSILQPTFIFTSSIELEHLANIFELYSQQPTGQIQRTVKKGLNSLQKFLATSKAMKMPENMFVSLKKMARISSKYATSGQAFLANGLDNLEFIVHGFTPASQKNVHFFETYGIPVIETYGTIHSVGVLSSNTYRRPYFNTIGAPLSHVYLKLGVHSTLSYKLVLDGYETSAQWHETGDVVQMTPFGFMLTEQKYHLFLEAGEPIEQKTILQFDKAHEVLHWSGSSIQKRYPHMLHI